VSPAQATQATGQSAASGSAYFVRHYPPPWSGAPLSLAVYEFLLRIGAEDSTLGLQPVVMPIVTLLDEIYGA
jgi:hypothetical protein